MKVTYYEDEDTLVIRLSDKAITREVSQDWHTHVSYAADGTVVETVILEAAKLGAWPLEVQHAAAA
jgi:hypothetical protein